MSYVPLWAKDRPPDTGMNGGVANQPFLVSDMEKRSMIDTTSPQDLVQLQLRIDNKDLRVVRDTSPYSDVD